MRIAIDCDPGNGIPGANTDDGLALGLAVAARELRLELVTTVAGNTPADVGAAVARELMRAWRVDVPIVVGARTPLVRDPAPWRRVLDREDLSDGHRRLWDGVPRPSPEHLADDGGLAAARALADLVRANPGEITVVAIGPLTNVANALRLDPGFARDVAGIAVMGAAFAVPGRAVDTNFGYDPHAAQAVLASGAPITVIPLDTTVRTLFTVEDLERLRRIDSPIAQSLARTTEPWLRYSADTRGIRGCWLHDVLVVAMLLDPSIVTTMRARVSVSLDEGAAQGAAVRFPDDGPRGAPVTLVDGVDNARLLGVFFGELEGQGKG